RAGQRGAGHPRRGPLGDRPAGPGASAAWLPLAGGPAALLTATAADAHTLRVLLTAPVDAHTPPGGLYRPAPRTGVDAVPVA
ncbi:hypothetical protein AB0M60_29805, partial [Micromonospora wenchangensis]